MLVGWLGGQWSHLRKCVNIYFMFRVTGMFAGSCTCIILQLFVVETMLLEVRVRQAFGRRLHDYLLIVKECVVR